MKIEDRRNLDQNARLWAALEDISDQVKWPVDGVEQLLAKEDWKVILTAGLRKEHRIAAGVTGGFVILGTPTSRMTKSEFSELIEFVLWFGNMKGVKWAREDIAA